MAQLHRLLRLRSIDLECKRLPSLLWQTLHLSWIHSRSASIPNPGQYGRGEGGPQADTKPPLGGSRCVPASPHAQIRGVGPPPLLENPDHHQVSRERKLAYLLRYLVITSGFSSPDFPAFALRKVIHRSEWLFS